MLANHTPQRVTFEVTSAAGQTLVESIGPGDSAPFFSSSPLSVAFGSGLARRVEQLAPDAVYRFAVSRVGGHAGVELRRIGLAGEPIAPAAGASWQVGAGGGDAPVPVLLCVDEEEPTHERVWSERLVERLAKASAIVARHSGVRFVPAGVRQWDSRDDLPLFEQTLAEFEQDVTPPDGTLAVGFTSQYHADLGRHRMGGTRGPLRRHVLVREWSPRLGEAERVEILVHELGHYLGAAHSPELTSVMRPTLGDRPVRLRSEEVRFDAVNTLAIAMVGEEVRGRGVRDLAQLSAARRERLQRIYGTLAALTPGEPAGALLLRRLAAVEGPREGAVTPTDRAEAAAATVVTAITRAAAVNQKRPFDRRATGDDLADILAAAAAAAAGDDARGYLLGVGVGLDDVGALRRHPRTSEVVAQVEPDALRSGRLDVLGDPSARGRPDLLKHFVVSAALAAVVGEKETHLWGVAKELADATRDGGSGFSFADLAADRAGVRFARGVLAGSPPLSGLAEGMRFANYLPSVEGLEEGLSLDELVKRFGGQGDPRFNAQLAEIDRRIEALPAYALTRLGLP